MPKATSPHPRPARARARPCDSRQPSPHRHVHTEEKKLSLHVLTSMLGKHARALHGENYHKKGGPGAWERRLAPIVTVHFYAHTAALKEPGRAAAKRGPASSAGEQSAPPALGSRSSPDAELRSGADTPTVSGGPFAATVGSVTAERAARVCPGGFSTATSSRSLATQRCIPRAARVRWPTCCTSNRRCWLARTALLSASTSHRTRTSS